MRCFVQDGCVDRDDCRAAGICQHTPAPGGPVPHDAPGANVGPMQQGVTRHPVSAPRLGTDSAARKRIPLCTGLLDYFPDALADVARLSYLGNEKHNPGQPLHWAREKSTDHADCLLRHQTDRHVIEDGVLHAAGVAWRALAQLQVMIEGLRAQGAQYPPESE